MKLSESMLRTVIKQELKVVLKEAVNFPFFKGLGQRKGESEIASTLAARTAATAPTPHIELPKVLNEVVSTIVSYGIDLKEIPYSKSGILSELNPMIDEFIGVGRKIKKSDLKIEQSSLIYSFEFENEIGNKTSGEYKLYIPFLPIKAPNKWVSLDVSKPPVLNPPSEQGIKMELEDWKNLISIYNENKVTSETQR